MNSNNVELQKEIEFYTQKVKETKAKLYSQINNKKQKPIVVNQKIKDTFAIYNGDSVEILSGIPDNSIHYTLFSPPFSSLYTYSDLCQDMGNSISDEEFYNHFKLIIPELYRILIPGRLLSFHCMNIPSMKERDGFIGLKDFRGHLIKLFQDIGFYFHSEVVIWKDPLIEATRTKAHGLMHKQLCKDSAMCRNGLPDYIVTMRKPGVNPEPVSRKNGFEYYIGEEKNEPIAEKHNIQKLNRYSQKVFQKYANSIWTDIRQTNTLNARLGRDDKDEKHLCPLQLDSIARCIEYWTNPGDTVLSPFGGIGSEGYQALLMGRKSISIELKESYYKLNVKHHIKAAKQKQNGLFE